MTDLDLKQIARDSFTVEDALDALHKAGASPCLAIEALVAAKGLSPGSAKRALYHSPSWTKTVRATEAMHKECRDAIDEIDDTQGFDNE